MLECVKRVMDGRKDDNRFEDISDLTLVEEDPEISAVHIPFLGRI